MSCNNRTYDPPLKRNSGLVLKSEDGDTRFELITEDRLSGNRILIQGLTNGSKLDIKVANGNNILHQIFMDSSSMNIKTEKTLNIGANSINIDTNNFTVNSDDIALKGSTTTISNYVEGT